MQAPVWDLYNEYRTAHLNVKYYSCQLGKVAKRNFVIEILVATSSSSSVAGLWLFSEWQSGLLWKLLGSVAALLAVYQPVAKLSDKLQILEKRVTAWQAIAFDLERLVRRVSAERAYSKTIIRQFENVMDRKQELTTSYVDPDIDDELRVQCAEQVKREFPVESFFVPEETK